MGNQAIQQESATRTCWGNGMKAYINRKKFIVYEPHYTQGDMHKTVYSWFQAKKLCNRWGVGSEISVARLKGGARIGSLSFWNIEDTFEWL